MCDKNKTGVYRVVLTGGPCAGKTTGLQRMKETAESKGFNVIVIPEVARLFIGAGMDPRTIGKAGNQAMQSHIVNTQLTLESSAATYLSILMFKNNKPGIAICDRGIADNGAYMDRITYHDILGRFNLQPHSVMWRYDAVFHMDTAALGAEKFYVNDSVRTDTPEAACALNIFTMAQWDIHDHFHRIQNPTHGNFQDKLTVLCEHFEEELSDKVLIKP